MPNVIAATYLKYLPTSNNDKNIKVNFNNWKKKKMLLSDIKGVHIYINEKAV